MVFLLRGKDDRSSSADFISSLIPKNALIFDVGANIGQSSEIFIRTGARVVAFEPQLELHGQIRQLCGPGARIEIIPLGLGSKIETRSFYRASYDQVASFREDWEGDHSTVTNIEISTLDEQIQKFGLPDYCKIDVEGWEDEVILGLSKPIKLLSFEFHLTENEIERTRRVLKRLMSLGPYRCNIKPPYQARFLLSENISIAEFIERFPHDLDFHLPAGFGDVFCRIEESC